MIPKYSLNVVNKALSLELKKVKDNDKHIIFHCKTTHSENHFYRIEYDKKFDKINCECDEFKHKRKCSHSLKALKLIKGSNWFYDNLKLEK